MNPYMNLPKPERIHNLQFRIRLTSSLILDFEGEKIERVIDCTAYTPTAGYLLVKNGDGTDILIPWHNIESITSKPKI